VKVGIKAFDPDSAPLCWNDRVEDIQADTNVLVDCELLEEWEFDMEGREEHILFRLSNILDR